MLEGDLVGQGRRALSWIAALGALALVPVVTSCAIAMSFDDYGSERRFRVGGTVSGLDGAYVVIVVDDVPHEVTDGAFTHPAPVADGHVYTLRVEGDPPGHSCDVAGGRGVIEGKDVKDVRVTCASSDATLESLSIVGSILSPAFAPRLHDYHARFDDLVSAMSGRVIALPTRRDARVMIAGTPVTSGAPRRPFSLDGETTIDVDVIAPDGKARRTYRVRLSAPSAKQRFVESGEDPRPGFGRVVAIGRDVFAASHDGIVRVYGRSNGSWVRDVLLRPDDRLGVTEFGHALAICGDELIVGSPQEDDDGGAAYVFRRRAEGWALEARLTPDPYVVAGRFGESVACYGDRAVVGAPCATSLSAACVERAFVFVGRYGAWTLEAALEDPFTRGRFGSAVAIDDETLAVAAEDDAHSAMTVSGTNVTFGAGSALVFRRIPAGWSREAHLYASTPHTQAHLGRAIALRGNVLAIGSDDPSAGRGIGATQDDASAVRAGAVHVFTRAGTTWAESAFVKSPDASAEGRFGSSLAMTDALIAIGASGEGGGALHFVSMDGTGWRFTGHVRPAVETGFAVAVAVHGIDMAVSSSSGAGTVHAH